MGAEFTEDAVLGGKLLLKQPRRGHRFGHDALLLAAACPARARERVVDLGAGVGAAGLALAWGETGGPITVTPTRSGYGTSLIRELIPHELGGRVDLVFSSDGVCCNIEIPLEPN